MALPVFDNANSVSGAAVSSVTIPAFLVSGTDRLIFVGVGTGRAGSPVSVFTVVRDGSETFVNQWSNVSDTLVSEGWTFLAPATGSFSIVVTLAGGNADQIGAGAISFTDVDQSAPLGIAETAKAAASPATVTKAAAEYQLLVDCVMTLGSNGLLTLGADQTSRWTQTGLGGIYGTGSSTQPGTFDDVMSWTFAGGTEWATGAIPINAHQTVSPNSVLAAERLGRAWSEKVLAPVSTVGSTLN